MTSDRPIFLVGCPRSGTTLVSALLHAHPRIAMPPETRFLIPAYEIRQQFGDLEQPGNRRRLARWITRPGWTKFDDLRLDRDEVVKKIVAGPPTFGSAAGIVWREFARSRGKARWGEKRPAYWRYLPTIRRLFPDAQVVHLIRDGRACVASLDQVPWWPTGRLGAMTTWALADRELRRAARTMPAGSYHAVRYEDVLADPRAALSAVCDFLGEDFDERMLEHAAAARDVVPTYKAWHSRTDHHLDPARADAWRHTLGPADIGLLETALGRRLRANGYDLTGDGTRPSAAALVAYSRAYAHHRAAIAKWEVRDALYRRHDRNPLAARITSAETAATGA